VEIRIIGLVLLLGIATGLLYRMADRLQVKK
jgi:hypothetical protein